MEKKKKEEKKNEDCLSCRVTGVAVCLSASAYLAWSAPAAALSSNRSARVAMLAGACLFGGLAAVRAVV